jgi:DNA-binding XRE family transcriptional regulator
MADPAHGLDGHIAHPAQISVKEMTPRMTGTFSPAQASSRWFAVVDGLRVRQLRRQHGLSAAELAGKAGIGLSTVTRIESQLRRSCRTRTLARLAAALDRAPAVLTSSQPPSHDDR